MRVAVGHAPPAEPPHRVRMPVNVHVWERISFLHFRIEPAALAALVPPELTVLTHDRSAWVSVTPFYIRVRLPGMPAVPGLTTFPETNVRTYVAGPDGREGIWFLRMEVPRLWFVTTLRALGLPYVRQRMAVTVDGDRITYRGEAGPDDPSHRVTVRTGRALQPSTGGALERFLTARWGAYHRRGPLLFHTPAEHPPWLLHAAEAETWEVTRLLEHAGLPASLAPPLVHWSPGVPVRIGRPQRVT